MEHSIRGRQSPVGRTRREQFDKRQSFCVVDLQFERVFDSGFGLANMGGTGECTSFDINSARQNGQKFRDVEGVTFDPAGRAFYIRDVSDSVNILRE